MSIKPPLTCGCITVWVIDSSTLETESRRLDDEPSHRVKNRNRFPWFGGASMAVLINAKIDALLESTSRSFYPTLKYLPKKIRGQIGLLYLLARVADTIADSKHGDTDVLLQVLKSYNDVAQGRSENLPDFSDIAELQTNASEAELLRNVEDVVEALEVYSREDQERMLECLDIIVGGQILDLERFGPAKEGGEISALTNDEQLDDYTYRVAGCVGVFWTKMSLAHLMSLSPEKEKEFFEKGIRFGKALQMINILRDIPEDLRFGRCYIPSDALARYDLKPNDLLDDGNIEKFRPLYDEYLDLANGHFDAAVEYIRMLPEGQFRLKASCMLPVLIGQRTVTLLRTGNILNSDERIKVTRDEIKVYARKLLRALLIPGGVKRLLEKNKDVPI
ncbi:MAG: farnesyl-diphosphate farnesyltransferase [Euryarchaeota archaeon]|nr:farnesyl-diphosphate farnesyltransferase [Euryarchaeota archaeon]